jgi:hypothetical protein
MNEELRGLISKNQHGYDKGRSTISILLEYTSFILKSMEDGLQVDSIYNDFSKALWQSSASVASNQIRSYIFGQISERMSSMIDLGVIFESKVSLSLSLSLSLWRSHWFCRQQRFRYVWFYKTLVTRTSGSLYAEGFLYYLLTLVRKLRLATLLCHSSFNRIKRINE